PSVGPTTLSSRTRPIDKVPVLQVQHQVSNRFGIPLVESEGDPKNAQEILQEDFELSANLPLRKRLCTAHTGTYEQGEGSTVAATRLGEPVRDDLYRFVDTVERGEGSTPAAMEVGYGITYAWDDLVGAIKESAPTTVEGVNQMVTKLSTTFDLDTSMIYDMIEEKRDDHAHKEPESTDYLGTRDTMLALLAFWRILDYNRDTAGGDQGVAGSRPEATGTVHTGTNCTEVMSDSADCSSMTHSDLRGRQSPSTVRGTGGGRALLRHWQYVILTETYNNNHVSGTGARRTE
nr:hypothetical protein [Tanacetum cinerariifolium]